MGGVINRQPVNQAITNAAFLFKNSDEIMPNKLGFTRALSGPSVADIQAAVNTLYDCTGASETETGTEYNATPNTIPNGVSHLEALYLLAEKFDAATGHIHSGLPGDAPPISGGAIGNVPYSQFVNPGASIPGATGSSTDVSILMSGKSPSTNSTTLGVIVVPPYNRVALLTQSGQEVIDSTGNPVYGRITFSASVWTLSYLSNVGGIEFPYTFTTPTDLQWFYRELYAPLIVTPVYQPLGGFEVDVYSTVRSLAASGNTPLFGDLLLAASGSGIQMHQSGNTIFISAPGSEPFDDAASGTFWGGPITGSPQPPAMRPFVPLDIPEGRNYLLNSDFNLWQRGTSTTIANGASTYLTDRWYVKNSLGTNGVITFSRQTGVSEGAKYGAKVQITTAPTAGQTNGTELYQTLENFDSLAFYNKNASFGVNVLGFGNVNQVGVQFYYKTTEAKVDTAIGSEQTFAVNTSTPVYCSIFGQAMGSSFTTSGVVGVRIRITGVSSGNLYDLNNGFQAELAQMNPGNAPSRWRRAYQNMGDELAACERFYDKSYDVGVDPGTASVDGWAGVNGYTSASAQKFCVGYFKTTKRVVPTVVFYDYAGNANRCSIEDAGGSVTNNQIVAINYISSRSFMYGAANGTHTGLIAHYSADSEI